MSIYICSKCGTQFPKWLGQCSACGSWGTITEDKVAKETTFKRAGSFKTKAAEVIDFGTVKTEISARINSGLDELDRVLGGGIVPGSLILLGGAPGIGKSTLVLQITDKLITNNKSVLYISGEESAEQIKLRVDRLNVVSKNLKFLGEINTETICAAIEKHKPALAIIDSIQTMFSSEVESEPGSVNQIRTSTAKFLETAKRTKVPIFLIGHITKEGAVAGPKTLEHLVDTVLYLEGDANHQFRILRAIKNRFGSTSEVGVFEMQETGLIEVKNPSEAFLANRDSKTSGSIVTTVVEGSRVFLVEVQALVSTTHFGYPQRKSAGFDFNRLMLLITVLMRRCGLNLANQDVFVNIVGGLEIKEPACDLAVALAIVSAFKNKPIEAKLIAVGEVGLGGEIRNIPFLDKRIKEAEKMGFTKIVVPITRKSEQPKNSEIIQARNLNEAIKIIFG